VHVHVRRSPHLTTSCESSGNQVLSDPLHDRVLCRVSWFLDLRLLQLLQNESGVLFRKGQQNIRRKQVGHLLQSTWLHKPTMSTPMNARVHLPECACGDIDLLQCVPDPPAVHVSCSPCLCRRLATSILSLLSVAIVVQYSCLGIATLYCFLLIRTSVHFCCTLRHNPRRGRAEVGAMTKLTARRAPSRRLGRPRIWPRTFHLEGLRPTSLW
jgi:hypothetical protein